jgi:hypothetical protein
VSHKRDRWAKHSGDVRGNLTKPRRICQITRGESMDACGSNVPLGVDQGGELGFDAVPEIHQNDANLDDTVMTIRIQARCLNINYSERAHSILGITTPC